MLEFLSLNKRFLFVKLRVSNNHIDIHDEKAIIISQAVAYCSRKLFDAYQCRFDRRYRPPETQHSNRHLCVYYIQEV